MSKQYKNREDEILRGYVKLVQAMLMLVYDRIRIKDSWRSKKLSQRMIDRKLNDLDELGMWLKGSDCLVWFNILSMCTGNGSRAMYETFMETHTSSLEFMNKQRAVDNSAVDRIKSII